MTAQRHKPPSWWYGDGSPPLGAHLVSGVFGVVTGLRRRMYRTGLLRSRSVGIPVVVIGNLVAGGSGKTPLTIAVVERLRAEGWNPGVDARIRARQAGRRAVGRCEDRSIGRRRRTGADRAANPHEGACRSQSRRRC